MSERLKDSERTKLIAYYIRTGESPPGYLITENETSKYKVRKIKSQQEILQAKRDRLRKQLESIEAELSNLVASPEPVKDKQDTKDTSEDTDTDEIFSEAN